MLDYEKLYRILFNGITDALEVFEREGYEGARAVLMEAQQAAEDYYIEGDDAQDAPFPLYILPHDRYE